MKLISCPHCGAKAIGPKTDQFPNGRPVVFGRWTGGPYPLIYKCHRCMKPIRTTAVQFNGLPSLSESQLKELGISPQPAVQSDDEDETEEASQPNGTTP